jgi:hypothetical protein
VEKNMSVLTVIDVSGIQKYIFGSNRLKEIIGASEIVNQATDKDGWIKSFLNSKDELIYAGGGNALIIFADIDRAKEFTRKYTHQILTEARGLEVVIAHSSDFGMDDLTPTILARRDEVFETLAQKKANRQTSSPLLGLAITAQCVSTGGVASFFDKDRKKYVSEESRLKLKTVTDANENLVKKLGLEEVTDWKSLDIPLDFDNLGRTQGESSFIAVVHTDGNGMGKRVIEAGTGKDNKECIEKMRQFSESIELANRQALQKAVRLLLWHIDSGNKTFTDKYGETFDLIINEKTGNGCFPFRPLIFGGDDLTFVCDGRIALALTAFYLKELAKIKLSDDKPPIYGRAGISIVKTHYPFSRAYQLAEELAANAKEIINEVDANEKKVLAMDWHVAMSGLLGSLGEIRQREYTVSEGKLNMRPVVVSSANQYNKWRTWDNFENVLTDFQSHSANKENWREKRNKVKLLREILRKGSNETRSFIDNLQPLPKLSNGSDIEKSGWESGICGYFDPIEMIDLFYQLDETKLGEQPNE